MLPTHRTLLKVISFIILSINCHIYALDLHDAKHLWSRTGFSSTNLLISKHKQLSRDEAIKIIIDAPLYYPPEKSLPKFNKELYAALRSNKTSKKEKQQIKKKILNKDRKNLQIWWYQQILDTKNPLQEKMTVFWHNHFTSDLQKVFPPYMLKQNQIFRIHGLGNFKKLLNEFMHDPAIHIYLDNIKNKKQNPNENLARELLELFTLGEGSHYSEQDIKNIAKALTGYRVDFNKQKLVFKKRQHDSSFVKIFNSSGSYSIDGVLKLILSHPMTAKFITEKFWREFISDKPDEKEIERISIIFRNSGYEIKELISEILHSESFWDKKNYNTLIKSPFDLLTSTLHLTQLNDSEVNKIPLLISKSGQKLFYPPDVRGWRGGIYWLSTELIIARKKMLRKYIKKVINNNKKTDPRYLSKVVNTITKKHQFFAIGDTIPKKITKPMSKLIYLLSHDKYNFK
ncbi:MAG: DUF1800 domain-containing protein [Gammaproteobacteria bacterium]|jgi:uncharacterized protein (DUF1800 family)|nr:DUF1800 domain-containing protein [Gammaproteobacteria bacterium]